MLSPLNATWVEVLKKKKVSTQAMTSMVQFDSRQKCRRFLSQILTKDDGRNLVYLHHLSKTKENIILQLHCSTSFTPIYIMKS